MREFESVEEMFEARAQASHEANLERGGVFNSEGVRHSDIEQERRIAKAESLRHVSELYARLDGLPGACKVLGSFGFVRIP